MVGQTNDTLETIEEIENRGGLVKSWTSSRSVRL